VIVLDASVLIGFLDAEDAHHRPAEDLLRSAVDEDLAANPLTLAEVLMLPTREGRLDRVLDVLRDLDVAELAFPPNVASRLARLRAETGLKMPDCCVLVSAEAADARIASFDERLRAAAHRRGVPVVA
jgi:predicted nucleic acid-binding protein